MVAVPVGEHDPGQRQGGDRRHLPLDQPGARRALPRQLRLAPQPALPARQPDPAAGPQRGQDRPAALRQAYRQLTFRATQVSRSMRIGLVKTPKSNPSYIIRSKFVGGITTY